MKRELSFEQRGVEAFTGALTIANISVTICNCFTEKEEGIPIIYRPLLGKCSATEEE